MQITQTYIKKFDGMYYYVSILDDRIRVVWFWDRRYAKWEMIPTTDELWRRHRTQLNLGININPILEKFYNKYGMFLK